VIGQTYVKLHPASCVPCS